MTVGKSRNAQRLFPLLGERVRVRAGLSLISRCSIINPFPKRSVALEKKPVQRAVACLNVPGVAIPKFVALPPMARTAPRADGLLNRPVQFQRRNEDRPAIFHIHIRRERGAKPPKAEAV